MAKIWVVVADEARARVFCTSNSIEPLQELKTFTLPESRLQEQQLVTDKQGSASNGTGQGRHGVAEKSGQKEKYATRFAKELAVYLEQQRQQKNFVKLFIVAAPHFLGLLRKQLNKNVTELVALEIAKDLSMQEANDIRQHLPEYL